jgi:hypothetical protein
MRTLPKARRIEQLTDGAYAGGLDRIQLRDAIPWPTPTL